MFAFSFGKITAVYFITTKLCLYSIPSINILNTTLNTPAFKYTVILRQTEGVRGCYCRLYR